MEKILQESSKIGFIPANQIAFENMMKPLLVEKEAAVKDAITVGMTKLLEMRQILSQKLLSQTYKFVHIIVTAADSKHWVHSDNHQAEDISTINFNVQSKLCKSFLSSYFIGINFQEKSQQLYEQMARTTNAKVYSIWDNQIDIVFNKILKKLQITKNRKIKKKKSHDLETGKKFEKPERGTLLTGVKTNFIICFNVDVSKEMTIFKAQLVTNAIQRSLRLLSEEDLVAVVVFNSKARCLTVQRTEAQLEKKYDLSPTYFFETCKRYRRTLKFIDFMHAVGLVVIFGFGVYYTVFKSYKCSIYSSLTKKWVSISSQIQLRILICCAVYLIIFLSYSIRTCFKLNDISYKVVLFLFMGIEFVCFFIQHLLFLSNNDLTCAGFYADEQQILNNPQQYEVQRWKFMLGIVLFEWGFILIGLMIVIFLTIKNCQYQRLQFHL